ncbi:uncharacterized protein FIBRA_07836 [Fibroporia radiculosa]|uniref:SNF5-domain-containing protein n=1 Tax=Fibroporia radiculosa TaxID=599839 RepID=J4I1G9_9APHY|nr:uncharacterized protein FIBRA_07836 [Fibroporia radiculosa]CCM05607.1 predicted protein [Fibroporia radiculosa]
MQSPTAPAGVSSMMGAAPDRKGGTVDGLGFGAAMGAQQPLAADGAVHKAQGALNGVAAATAAGAQAAPQQKTGLDASTRISEVPLKDVGTLIPPLGEDEIAKVKAWMKVEKEYDVRHKAMREQMHKEVLATIGKPRAWWEKDAVVDDGRVAPRRRPEKFALTGLKNNKDREMRDRRKAGKREGFKHPRRLKPEDANRPEQLVPIRLEFDVEHQKMRDAFVWNLNDPVVTPEVFAQSIVDDYGLAPSYHTVITKAIQDQLSDFKAHSTTFGEDGIVAVSPDGDDGVQCGSLDGQDAEWWEAWRERVRSDTFLKQVSKRPDNRSRKRRKVVKEEAIEQTELAGLPGSEVPMTVDEFEEEDTSLQEEMRILVKLDIIVGPMKLEDQFEWNLDNDDPSPEHFAEIYAQDLGLGGEFKTAIAHSIREQVQIYQKSLFLVGHPSDGSAVQDDDLRMSLLPSLTTGARAMDQVTAFTPIINYLSDSEIERNEKEREKELNRRRRKTTRGRRGVALPDREPPKTFRTPAIGFPEVDAATLSLLNAAAAPTSRRAAAAAASLTIANMVASENGTVVLPPSQPMPITPAASTAPKEKKPKGLFKPPSYPSSVLRTRPYPVQSTVADPSSFPPPMENDLPLPSNIDNKGARVMLPFKKAKELEREAKEKEYVDGQHANMIDGVWHCSNCGCPESIAIGRRKGPLGDKSQCGTCGKFWHRHRRPRPVEYNSNAEYHINLLREAEQARVAAKRKRPPPSTEQPTPAPTEDADVETGTPSRPDNGLRVEIPTVSSIGSAVSSRDRERPTSPGSTTSSASESPLAQRTVRSNGTGHSKSAPPDNGPQDAEADNTPTGTAPPLASPQPPRPSAPPPYTYQSLPIPAWLREAMIELQTKYPHDLFEVTIRRANPQANPEWRLKCLDCPGKLYTPGPGETLQNYEVHLRNRQHRQKVNARIGLPTATA